MKIQAVLPAGGWYAVMRPPTPPRPGIRVVPAIVRLVGWAIVADDLGHPDITGLIPCSAAGAHVVPCAERDDFVGYWDGSGSPQELYLQALAVHEHLGHDEKADPDTPTEPRLRPDIEQLLREHLGQDNP